MKSARTKRRRMIIRIRKKEVTKEGEWQEGERRRNEKKKIFSFLLKR